MDTDKHGLIGRAGSPLHTVGRGVMSAYQQSPNNPRGVKRPTCGRCIFIRVYPGPSVVTMNRFPETKSTRRAFTLIELLVVIAIISILAALLLPVLSKAKNQAGKATDLNNLKQIMVAVHIYASDDEDVLPSANWDDGNGDLPGWLYTPGPADVDPKTGQLWATLRSERVYVCPNDNLQMAHWSKIRQKVMERSQQVSSYAMN